MNEYKFVFPNQNNSCIIVNARNLADAVFFVREMCDLVDARFNAVDCNIMINSELPFDGGDDE